jgi:hypothetical protein
LRPPTTERARGAIPRKSPTTGGMSELHSTCRDTQSRRIAPRHRPPSAPNCHAP